MPKNTLLILVLAIVGFGCISASRNANSTPFIYDGTIVIKGTINGLHQGTFVLDTGADGLLLDSSFFAKTKIKGKNFAKSYIRGAGLKDKLNLKLLLDSITFNNNAIQGTSHRTGIIDLRGLLLKDIDGIVGSSFLQNKITHINFDDLLIYSYRQEDVQSHFPGTSVDIEFKANRPYAKAELLLSNGESKEDLFLIDLGSATGMLIHSPFVNLFEGLNDKREVQKLIGGIGGHSNSFECRGEEIKIGDLSFYKPIVSCSTDKKGSLADTREIGLIGNAIFSKTNLTLDFISNKLFLAKNNNHKIPFAQNKSGFIINHHDSISELPVVVCLYPGSNAHSLGLNLGDSLVSINNKSIFDISNLELQNIYKQEITNITFKQSIQH